jgi:hypothetical protein
MVEDRGEKRNDRSRKEHHMTPEERDFLRRYPNVREATALAIFGLLKCGEETKEGAKRAAEHGVVGRWVD